MELDGAGNIIFPARSKAIFLRMPKGGLHVTGPGPYPIKGPFLKKLVVQRRLGEQ